MPDKNAARNRPDAVIEGVDEKGRLRWLGVEVDLGHYSRERIVGKVNAWRAYPDADALLIIVPDEARRERVQGWIPAGRHVPVLTPAILDDWLERAKSEPCDGIFMHLDIWTGGDGWEARREWQRQFAAEEEQRQREQEALKAAEEQRERAAEDARRQAEHLRQDRARRGRRRFGV